MSKTAAAIAAAKAEGRAVLVGYLPLGFPDYKTSVTAAIALANSGADILELGPPYSDPAMDGAVIQEATSKALANGFKVADIFRAVQEITGQTSKPILIMSYWNLIFQYGVREFIRDLALAGGVGVITPDITPENAAELIAATDEFNLDRVFLAAQTSSDSRLKMIAETSRGFVYAVSTLGITGARDSLDSAASELTRRLKAAGAENVCVGIGISTRSHISAVSQYADGAIVGSVLVAKLRDSGVTGLQELTAELAAGLYQTQQEETC